MFYSELGRLKHLALAAVTMGTLITATTTIATSAEIKPINIRFAADLTGPPHPAGIAMQYFREKLAKRVPGSKVRIYYAGSLYNIPAAIEAMREGNLEMAWGQYGKSAQIDPYANIAVGPMLLTTPGAMNKIEGMAAVKMLKKRFADLHGIHIFANAHLSMYMGAGSGSRLLRPSDFKGKKIRSMGPAENSSLSAWGANPTTMAFGDVPPALQTGVIDGLLTSLGGFNVTKDQAPFFTVAGINGIVGDYYTITGSMKWWKSLEQNQRDAINDILLNDVVPFQKKMNWCNDKRLIDKYETKDPSKPGIYIMTPAEAKALADAMGDAHKNYVYGTTPDDANKWVDSFHNEAAALVAANPLGSDPLEKTDCKKMAKWFTHYKKYVKKKKK